MKQLFLALYILIQLSALTHLCLSSPIEQQERSLKECESTARRDTLQNWSVDKKQASLKTGASLVSLNGEYKAIMQKHGELRIFNKKNKLIAKVGKYISDVKGPGHHITMQPNGNLVIYNDKTSKATWNAGTVQPGPEGSEHYLRLENTGVLIMYGANGRIIWDSKNGLAPEPEIPEDNGDNNQNTGEEDGDNNTDDAPSGTDEPVDCAPEVPKSSRPDTLQNWAAVGEEGSKLQTGDSLVSMNGEYKAVMQNNGQLLILDKNDDLVKEIGTVQEIASSYRLVMQEDGNLVIYNDDTGRPTWASGTYVPLGQCYGRGYFVRLLDNGMLEIYNRNEKTAWNSETLQNDETKEDSGCSPRSFMGDRADTLQNWATVGEKAKLHVGDYLVSPNGAYKAVLQSNGELQILGRYDDVIASAGGAFNGADQASSYSLVMQADGNLVIYNDDTGGATWASNTLGANCGQKHFLQLLDIAALVMYDEYGTNAWILGGY